MKRVSWFLRATPFLAGRATPEIQPVLRPQGEKLRWVEESGFREKLKRKGFRAEGITATGSSWKKILVCSEGLLLLYPISFFIS
jgi:hypothetical protein